MSHILNIEGLQRFLTRRKLERFYQVIQSFWPWRADKFPTAGSLPIKLQRQWTTYSCTAACSQMILAYYGIRISHKTAVALTRCKPNGAYLGDVARAIKRKHKLEYRLLKRRSHLNQALKRGEPVLSTVTVEDPGDHAVLVIGTTPKGVWIADPGTASIYWRNDRTFFKGADEFYAFSA